MSGLSGRVALITGAARGQGRAHALALAKAGADVALLDMCEDLSSVPYALATQADLKQTVADVEALGGRVFATNCDVRDSAALQAAVEEANGALGPVDVLVANAGIWTLAPLWEITDDQWQQMLDVNLTGVWRTMKAVLPEMMARRSGSIVLTSSTNGFEAGPGFAHYTAAKHGVLGLMKTAAVELGPYNIRCNAVCPGFVDSKMNDWQGAWDMMKGGPGGTHEDRGSAAYNWPALAGRSMIDPSAISAAVAWLASDAAAEITGVALPIDAGHLVLPGFNHNPVRPE